jgi:hypothetical protein
MFGDTCIGDPGDPFVCIKGDFLSAMKNIIKSNVF